MFLLVPKWRSAQLQKELCLLLNSVGGELTLTHESYRRMVCSKIALSSENLVQIRKVPLSLVQGVWFSSSG